MSFTIMGNGDDSRCHSSGSTDDEKSRSWNIFRQIIHPPIDWMGEFRCRSEGRKSAFDKDYLHAIEEQSETVGSAVFFGDRHAVISFCLLSILMLTFLPLGSLSITHSFSLVPIVSALRSSATASSSVGSTSLHIADHSIESWLICSSFLLCVIHSIVFLTFLGYTFLLIIHLPLKAFVRHFPESAGSHNTFLQGQISDKLPTFLGEYVNTVLIRLIPMVRKLINFVQSTFEPSNVQLSLRVFILLEATILLRFSSLLLFFSHPIASSQQTCTSSPSLPPLSHSSPSNYLPVFICINFLVIHILPLCAQEFLPSIPVRHILLTLTISVLFVLFSLILCVLSHTTATSTLSVFNDVPVTFTDVLLLYPLFLGLLFVTITRKQYQRSVRFYQYGVLTRALEREDNESSGSQVLNDMKHLIANVAHDLKTPLASFLSGIELIQVALNECKGLVPTHTNYVLLGNMDTIQTTITTVRGTYAFMLMTINRCLDYTKASKGVKLTPKLETFMLQEALELPMHCIANMQSKITVCLEPLPEDLCACVISDKQWLQENLLCLLSNALKYSLEGSVTIRVSLSGDPDISSPSDADPSQSTFLRIEVEDTGIGMSEESMASLFSPFKQTQRLAGGTGLGLYSLSKRLEALHGHYGVTHRRDGQQGSLFWFAVPYKPDELYLRHCMLQKSETSAVHGLSTIPGSNPTASHTTRLQNNIGVVTPRFAFPLTTSNIGKCKRSDGVKSAPPSLAGSSPFDTPLERSNGSLNQLQRAQSPRLSSLPKLSIAIPQQHSDVCTHTPYCNAATPVHSSLLSDSQDTSSTPRSILLVDDSPTILKMSAMLLQRLGHEVKLAENGAVAVKLYEQSLTIDPRTGRKISSFDVILMDLQMPVMDGLEATRRIRDLENDRSTHRSRHNSEASVVSTITGTDNDSSCADDSIAFSRHQMIVGISANSDSDTMDCAKQAGIDAFLPKPFDLQRVQALLNKCDE